MTSADQPIAAEVNAWDAVCQRVATLFPDTPMMTIRSLAADARRDVEIIDYAPDAGLVMAERLVIEQLKRRSLHGDPPGLASESPSHRGI